MKTHFYVVHPRREPLAVCCYGCLGGSWGTDNLRYLGRYDGLLYARLNPLGAYCLGLTGVYEGAPQRAAPFLRVLPTRDVVFLDRDAIDAAEIALLERIGRLRLLQSESASFRSASSLHAGE